MASGSSLLMLLLMLKDGTEGKPVLCEHCCSPRGLVAQVPNRMIQCQLPGTGLHCTVCAQLCPP